MGSMLPLFLKKIKQKLLLTTPIFCCKKDVRDYNKGGNMALKLENRLKNKNRFLSHGPYNISEFKPLQGIPGLP
jgi:hypothetical protein